MLAKRAEQTFNGQRWSRTRRPFLPHDPLLTAILRPRLAGLRRSRYTGQTCQVAPPIRLFTECSWREVCLEAVIVQSWTDNVTLLQASTTEERTSRKLVNIQINQGQDGRGWTAGKAEWRLLRTVPSSCYPAPSLEPIFGQYLGSGGSTDDQKMCVNEGWCPTFE